MTTSLTYTDVQTAMKKVFSTVEQTAATACIGDADVIVELDINTTTQSTSRDVFVKWAAVALMRGGTVGDKTSRSLPWNEYNHVIEKYKKADAHTTVAGGMATF